jgi:hypothetical protein
MPPGLGDWRLARSALLPERNTPGDHGAAVMLPAIRCACRQTRQVAADDLLRAQALQLWADKSCVAFSALLVRRALPKAATRC